MGREAVQPRFQAGLMAAQIRLENLGEVTVTSDRAIICVVGEGLRDTPGLAGRVFKALGTLNVDMISQGASRINLTFVVPDAQATEAVKRLHEEFFPASTTPPAQ